MTEDGNRAYRILRAVILVCFFIPAAFITMLGLFSTCHITSAYNEAHYFVDARGWPVLLFFALFLALLWLLRRCGAADWLASHKLGAARTIIAVMFAAGVGLVAAAQVVPGADQQMVVSIAARFRAGDYSDLFRGGYLYRYPHQIGLMWFYYLTSFICGSGNTIFWQLCNAAALAGGVWFFARTAELLFPRPWMLPAAAGCCCLFLPLTFYTTFNYGTLYGFCASSAAFYCLARRLDGGGWKYAAGMALLAALAVLLKQNYMIAAAAMAVVLLLEAVKRKKAAPLLEIAVLLAAVWLLGEAALGAASAVSGRQVPEGMPKSAWVMMGLQESRRGPGWYNAETVELFENMGDDPAATDAAARREIAIRLKTFASDPGYAMQFFAKKISSQWVEPTFQCFWISSVRTSFASSPQFIKNLLAGDLSAALERYLRVYELFVLLGALGYVLTGRREARTGALLFAVTFVGGFLFHIVWEAKGEYTLTYFVMLMPYALEGWAELAVLPERLARAEGPMGKKLLRPALTLALAAVLLIHPVFVRSTLGLSCDNETYHELVSDSAGQKR
jgi:hypothetical protein